MLTRLDVRALALTPERFLQLCSDNRDLRLELSAQQELLIQPPAPSLMGWRNAQLTYQLAEWAEQTGTGVVFDFSTGFALPNGAIRSPDASWLRRERWAALSEAQRKSFAPLCPDFVVELRSESDSLSLLETKMEEYLANGAALGWLIDPDAKQVYRYRPGEPVQRLDELELVAGEGLLAGFVFRVSEIW